MKQKLLSILFVLFIAGLFVGCGSTSTPEDMVKEFFGYIEDGNADAAIDMMSPQLVQMVGNEKLTKAIEEQSKEIKDKKGIDSIEFLEKDEKEDSIEMKIKINYGDGTSKTDKAKLVKEDGEWKVGASK